MRAATVVPLIFMAGCTAGHRSDGALMLHEHAVRGWPRVEVESLTAPADSPDFDDAHSVLVYVLSRTGARPVVYPTELYYYYKFPLGPRRVSGNIRLVDADRGVFSVGYFDEDNPADMRTREFRDGEDGVRVRLDDTRHKVHLSVGPITRVFVLDQSALTPPAFPLLPGEEFISGVRDESGYYLDLIYWRTGRSFYYVLNPERPRPETWSQASERPGVWFGDTSRFCFLRDAATGRFILVGVHRGQIERNTWYDGPFDQVPPRLQIRAILEQAYPYVKEAGGLDEHGNFLKQAGQRVAISPYRAYQSGPTLVGDIRKMIGPPGTPAAWTTLTYEYKRDWRAPAPPAGGHQAATSAKWPPNHWGASSRSWGIDHDAALSATWPPNHDATTSTQPGGH